MEVCMNKLKYIAVLLLISIFAIYITGCTPYKYDGDYIDLYTVAVNSIFSARGRVPRGEIVEDPTIEIIEEDEHGRTMFFYYEGYKCCDDEDHIYNQAISCCAYAIIIMQKSDDGYVYFYEDDCYEIFEIENEISIIRNKEYKNHDYSKLKEKNDWGKPINENECVKKPFTTQNSGELKIYEWVYNEIISAYAKGIGYKGNDNIFRLSVFNTSDIFGRELYYVWGAGRDVLGEGVSPNSVSQCFHFAIIFNPDGTYNQETCIIEIDDTINFKEKLIEFKLLNNWNQPYTK